MINISQWRTTIGLWCCHQTSYKTKKTQERTTNPLWFKSSLSGDIEINPGPPKTNYELTSNNAFILLHECGFQVFNHWETLSQFLHLPLDERKRLRESARISENYNLIIEEALDWWIAHSCHPSWEELVKAVDNCGERCTACEMRKRLCINIANSENTDDKAPPDIQQYCDIVLDQYKYQPIVPADWPPRVGQDFFGRLAMLEIQDGDTTSQTMLQKQWCMLRGLVDKIPEVTQSQQIDIQDILKPSETGQSLRVVVDGPPGIGKTTLCRKLVNMWTKRELMHKSYNLVIYCPLRKDEITQASELKELLQCIYKSHDIATVIKWLDETHGERLLIIFDGWDELSSGLRQSSLAARIIHRKLLAKCSVIITSRTYASSSLLELPSINRHIEILGFSEKEVQAVVQGTLVKEPHLAKKLIKDLEIRNDVQSLCYISLVCSIVILVYRKSNGELPTTLTELYINFVLQTIRRHVKIKNSYNIEPRQLRSLHDLPSNLDLSFQELCRFAYLSLKENNPNIMHIQFKPASPIS